MIYFPETYYDIIKNINYLHILKNLCYNKNMDNNDFEQQFTKNLKDSAPVVAQPMEASVGSSKLPLIVAIVLAVVTLLESIALIIALNNVNTALSFNEVEEYTDEELAEGDYYDETICHEVCYL